MKNKLCTGLALGAILLAGPAPVAFAQDASAAPSASNVSKEERQLEQKLSSDEPISTDQAVISEGHVDMGPKFVDGQWKLMIHDDHASTPVWRNFSDVVLKGSDAAKMPVPDDSRYSFVEAKPGNEVYVIPQTEATGVVWPGWNTQDPEVVSRLGRGMDLTMESVEGPGQMSLYLENGNFSAPQVLWNSAEKKAQNIWVGPNTHTHANWVFTAPGVYTVKVTAHAKLKDGTEVSDTQNIRFAVGDSTDAQAVLASSDHSSSSASATADSSAENSEAGSGQDRGRGDSAFSTPLIAGGIVVVLALLIGGITLNARRTQRNQQEAQRRIK